MIYIPGMEGTGRLFYRQEPELASQYTVIIYPLPKEPPFGYEDMVRDILEILDQEDAAKATIVGESFGGTVALHFALEHSDRLERLVLVNTFPYYRNRFRLRLGSTLLPLAYFKPTRFCWNAILKPIFRKEFMDEAGIARLVECSFSQGFATSQQRWKLVAEHDVRKRLSEITVPVLIVAAGKDKVVPSVPEAQLMSSKMKNSRVVILPKHGHTCMITTSFSLLEHLEKGRV